MKNYLLIFAMLGYANFTFSMDMGGQFSVVREQSGRNTNFKVVQTSSPTLSLHFCAECNQESSLKCSACKGVFYCSADHQKNGWKKHKKECAAIAQAQKGDLQQLRNFFDAAVIVAERQKTEEAVLECYSWFYRLLVRVSQDKACSTDASTQGAVGHIQMDCGPKLAQFEKDFDQQKRKKVLAKAIEWAQDLTENDDVVSPHGIKRYGMGIILEQFGGPAQPDALIASQEWKDKRLNVLTKMKEQYQ